MKMTPDDPIAYLRRLGESREGPYNIAVAALRMPFALGILKLRALRKGNNRRAIDISRRMVLLAPKEPESGTALTHLNEEEGAPSAARKAYETCLALTNPDTVLHNEAAHGLQDLKRRLNQELFAWR